MCTQRLIWIWNVLNSDRRSHLIWFSVWNFERPWKIWQIWARSRNIVEFISRQKWAAFPDFKFAKYNRTRIRRISAVCEIYPIYSKSDIHEETSVVLYFGGRKFYPIYPIIQHILVRYIRVLMCAIYQEGRIVYVCMYVYGHAAIKQKGIGEECLGSDQIHKIAQVYLSLNLDSCKQIMEISLGIITSRYITNCRISRTLSEERIYLFKIWPHCVNVDWV